MSLILFVWFNNKCASKSGWKLLQYTNFSDIKWSYLCYLADEYKNKKLQIDCLTEWIQNLTKDPLCCNDIDRIYTCNIPQNNKNCKILIGYIDE